VGGLVAYSGIVPRQLRVMDLRMNSLMDFQRIHPICLRKERGNIGGGWQNPHSVSGKIVIDPELCTQNGRSVRIEV